MITDVYYLLIEVIFNCDVFLTTDICNKIHPQNKCIFTYWLFYLMWCAKFRILNTAFERPAPLIFYCACGCWKTSRYSDNTEQISKRHYGQLLNSVAERGEMDGTQPLVDKEHNPLGRKKQHVHCKRPFRYSLHEYTKTHFTSQALI